MDIQQPLDPAGWSHASQFMRRHWHKKPLLVRQAIPNFQPPVLRPGCLRWRPRSRWSRAWCNKSRVAGSSATARLRAAPCPQ